MNNNSSIKFTTVIASCLIKHKRFEYLKETVSGIKKMFGDSCDEIIVLFDKIGIDKMINVDKCVTHNNGLGFSFNEGMRLAKNEMILQIEDDWVPNNNFKSFEQGIHIMAYNIMKQKKGVVRLYADPIHSKPDPNIDGWILGTKFCTDPCFHLELIKPKKEDIKKHWLFSYYYTNAPQFKLKSFSDEIGKYDENCSPVEVEKNISSKFYNSDHDYKIYFICAMFVINGNESIRDNDYKLNCNDNVKYNYEKIISLGNHHLTGKILKFAGGEYDKFPFDRTFTTLSFLIDLFNNDFTYFRNIINDEKQHYGNNKNYISFPEKNLKNQEDKNYYLKCTDNLEYVLNNNCTINFIFSIYKIENDDLNPNSNKTNEIIDDLEKLQKIIKEKYNCTKIGMSIITFDENNTYDNKKINYTFEKINNKTDMHKIIIQCNNITNTNWNHILESNIDTIYKLYCDLHTI